MDQVHDGVVDHFEKVKGEREGSSTVGVGPGQCWENDDLKEVQPAVQLAVKKAVHSNTQPDSIIVNSTRPRHRRI